MVSQDERLDVLDTLAKYCQYGCGRRYEDWAGLFAEDGQLIGIDNVPQVGRETLVKHIKSKHLDPNEVVKNINVNPIIEINGDRATVTSDFVVVQIFPDESRVVLAGRYSDELQKEASGWKFVVRRITYAQGDG